MTDEVLCHQLLVALVVGAGDGQLGFGLGHLGTRQLVVELDHQLALLHPLAVAEIDSRHPPTYLGAHHHALPRAQRAHRLRVIHQPHGLDLGHLDTCCSRTGGCPRGWRGGRTRAAGRRARRITTLAALATHLARDLRLTRTGRGRLVLIPPGTARGSGDADNGNHDVEGFLSHEDCLKNSL